jgi:AcrR family transcriptional regulator
MTSERHRTQGSHREPPSRSPSNRVEDEAILDAARACVLAVGVRRTTLSEVARRAGVSRMTLYRRHPDLRGLLAALMTREFGNLLRDASASAQQGRTARERLVIGSVEAAHALGRNQLMRAVLDLDPQLIVPYVMERIGTTQRIAEGFLLDQIVEGHQDGSIRRGEPRVQTRALFLVVQSFVLSMRPASSDLDDESLFDELRHLVEAALRPTQDDRHEQASHA